MDRKRYEDLTFTDDFIFCKVLENSPDLAKELLEIILGFKISKVEVQKQKVLDSAPNAKSVRFDVYAADEDGVIYDIEMQTTGPKKLTKRSRYYQSKIDNSIIEKNEPYEALRKTYIIFICLSDPFNENRCLYTFENICREDKDLSLGDEAYKVFVNAKGNTNEASDCLKHLLEFLRNNKTSDKFTQKLEEKVEEAQHNMDWREMYMSMSLKEHDDIMRGRQERDQEIIARQLKKGKSIAEIAEWLDLPEEEILELIEELRQPV